MKPFARLAATALCICFCGAVQAQSTRIAPWPREPEAPNAPKPPAPSRQMAGLVGAYGPESDPVYVLEHGGKLFAVRGHGAARPVPAGEFKRDAGGAGRALTLAGATYSRLHLGPTAGTPQLRVNPLRPVAAVLAESATQQPPAESGTFRPPDLVELVSVDPSIKLDIR